MCELLDYYHPSGHSSPCPTVLSDRSIRSILSLNASIGSEPGKGVPVSNDVRPCALSTGSVFPRTPYMLRYPVGGLRI